MLKHKLFTSATRTFVRSTGMVAALAMTLSLSACNKDMSGPGGTDNNNPVVIDPSIAIPTSPGAMTAGLDNPLGNAARIELGRHLFYDGRISIADKSITDDPNNRAPGISCGSCHNPAQGFSDPRIAKTGIPFSEGVQGKIGTRNAPGLTNVGYNATFTWDGKFASLEKHVPGPMFSQVEMGNNLSRDGSGLGEDDGYDHTPGSNDTLLLFMRMQKEESYAKLFADAYGDPSISLDRMVKAIAAFERTFVSTNSSFDEYNKFLHNQGGNENAISESAKRGFKLFIDPVKANCISCHSGYNFIDSKLHNNGLMANDKDPGAGGAPGKNNNNTLFNFFKVPTLRNVALSAPYMHNGSLATLSDVVMHYNSGGHDNSKKEIKPLGLTTEEQADLVAFLESLTDQNFATNTAFSNPWIK